jgi:hypothetical protein
MRLIGAQVAAERETMNSHAESLDTKAGVALAFAGVLVGLGATAQGFISNRLLFQVGLVMGEVGTPCVATAQKACPPPGRGSPAAASRRGRSCRAGIR